MPETSGELVCLQSNQLTSQLKGFFWAERALSSLQQGAFVVGVEALTWTHLLEVRNLRRGTVYFVGLGEELPWRQRLLLLVLWGFQVLVQCDVLLRKRLLRQVPHVLCYIKTTLR